MIVGLFTELLPAGGVQRTGRHVAAVAAKFATDRGLAYRFLSLNDPPGPHTVRVGPAEFLFSGYARNKLQFGLAALRAAGRQPPLVIALHPHLAPVVAMMRLRSGKFRSIVFSHGLEVWQPLGWLRGSALRSADLVIAPSRDTAHHLVSEQQIRTGRIRRLAWGLDPEFEARLRASVPPSRPADFPERARVILTVGRWDPAGEGFGLVFLEAMACAKPAIGGAHGGTPDVIEDGVTGLLVPHGDAALLSSALESLLADPSRAYEMGARGRERVQAAYTFDRFQTGLSRAMEDVLIRQH
jgi:glycosyltransferase involved in cell wall biosynthesis